MNGLVISVFVLYISIDSAGMLGNTFEWSLGIGLCGRGVGRVVRLNVRASPWYSGT